MSWNYTFPDDGPFYSSATCRKSYRKSAYFRGLLIFDKVVSIVCWQEFFKIFFFFFYSSASLRPLIREDNGVQILRSGC